MVVYPGVTSPILHRVTSAFSLFIFVCLFVFVSFVLCQNNSVMVDWAETRGNKEDDERGVYITNVDESVEDEDFRKHFGRFGVIEKVYNVQK